MKWYNIKRKISNFWLCVVAGFFVVAFGGILFMLVYLIVKLIRDSINTTWLGATSLLIIGIIVLALIGYIVKLITDR